MKKVKERIEEKRKQREKWHREEEEWNAKVAKDEKLMNSNKKNIFESRVYNFEQGIDDSQGESGF